MGVTSESSVLRQALAAIGNRILAAAAIALIVGGIWATLADAPFIERFGWSLAIAGAMTAIPQAGMFGKQISNEARQWLGAGPEPPERDLDTGAPGLTRIGVLLFVSIPLFALGAFVSTLA